MITAQEYQDKYGDMMLDGLSSTDTYIPLRVNARYGTNVAIRPMVFRLSDDVVMFGGKFRVGFTLDGNEFVQAKVVDLHSEQKMERLAEFCKGFSWQKQGSRRFSTVMGFGIAAGPYDGEAILAKLVEDQIAGKMLDSIEKTYKKYNDVGFGPLKRKAVAALQDAWLLQAQNCFAPMPETQVMPDKVLGKSSKLLNKAQDKYHDNVVSFKQKVAEAKEKNSA